MQLLLLKIWYNVNQEIVAINIVKERSFYSLTRKLWFQVGVGILLFLLIVKFFVEVNWLFDPILTIIKSIFIPLLIGGVLFYITVPLQTFLEKYKFPRWSSILTIFVLLSIGIWIAITIIGPPITEQITNLIKNTPAIITEIETFVLRLMEQTGDLPNWVTNEINNLTDSIKSISLEIGGYAFQFSQSVITGTFQGVIIAILSPFFLFFMLKDHEKFVPAVTRFFSGETKEWLSKTLKDIDEVLRLYIQGQILISFILAIMLYLGYTVIGLNFALLLAVFAFFMNVIPFIGPWIAFIPALIIGLIQDPMLVIWVSLITLVANQIDANLITPNIMGKTLKIHPLTIITILLAAGKIAGFFGILLAVPGYAVGKAIVTNIYDKRKEIRASATKEV